MVLPFSVSQPSVFVLERFQGSGFGISFTAVRVTVQLCYHKPTAFCYTVACFDHREGPMQITAAVAEQKSSPFTIQTLELDAPRWGEILIRVIGAGVCSTDLFVREHGFPPILPAVLGHEGSGVVEQVGPGVTKVQPGDPVVMTFASCGNCARCLREEPAYCASFYELNCSGRRPDGSPVLYGSGHAVSGRFLGQSSFATYALSDERSVVKVPEGVSLASLGPLGCSIQTGMGVVMNSLRVQAGTSIAVFGVGAVGMSAVMAARIVDCATIIAIDTKPERLAMAQTLGATHTIHAVGTQAAEVALVPAVREVADGGVDYTVEATGVPSVLRAAVEALNNRGMCGAVGMAPHGAEVSLPMSSILMGRTIRGVLEGDSVPDVFIPKLVELHREGKLPFDRLIRYYSLNDINQAADDVQNGVTIKPVLRMA